jgi:hypothetical protein
MRILKHFKKKLKGFYVGLTCKHEALRESSCPFTGITYTVCDKCTKILKGVRTNE